MLKETNIVSEFEDPGNERAVLAAVVSIPNSIIDIYDVLKDDDFITPHNKSIYVCLSSLYREEGVTVFDITTVVNKASNLGLMDACGGFDYINSLFNTVVLKENIKLSVTNVLENSSKKFLFDKVRIIQGNIVSNISGAKKKSAGELISYAEGVIADASAHTNRVDEAVNIGSGIIEFVEGLISAPTKIRGIQTGYPILDERINGLIPGTLTILAARAKTGKSMVLLNWAKHISYIQKIPVLYIDTEMSTEEVRTRTLSCLSGIPERVISNGSFGNNGDQLGKVLQAAQIIRDGQFYHKYVPGATMDKISSLARKYKVHKNIGILIFDYIKLPDSTDLRLAKEHQFLGYITAGLKDLAGTLNIPVVTAAQIGRVGANKGYLRSDMIADSDRLLRYCNNMLGFCSKSNEELEKIKKEGDISSYLRQYGGHRLQILDTRAGGTLFEGINISMRPRIIKVDEAICQNHIEESPDIDDYI